MDLENICNNIRSTRKYTDDTLNMLETCLLSEDLTGYTDPRFKVFADLINNMPFEPRIQDIISKLVDSFESRGILSPCATGCSDECTFHESEFGS